jgi:hypothetical protein
MELVESHTIFVSFQNKEAGIRMDMMLRLTRNLSVHYIRKMSALTLVN